MKSAIIFAVCLVFTTLACEFAAPSAEAACGSCRGGQCQPAAKKLVPAPGQKVRGEPVRNFFRSFGRCRGCCCSK